MTTQSDWKFRYKYLNDAAKRMEAHADDLAREAARYRELALMAKKQIRKSEQP